MTKSILVVGATGKQGRAFIDAMIASKDAASFKLLGLTRTPTSASAQALAEKGVTLVQGNLNNIPDAFKTAKELAGGNIWGLFVVLVRSTYDSVLF
jgi:uncharacterized protein YbjT (DUF2867 family)